MREIIRGEIVTQYTLIDERLAMAICDYMFPSKSHLKLWKHKRFELLLVDLVRRMSGAPPVRQPRVSQLALTIL